jgi:23S rRNA pseudouridine2605 synthase
MTDKQTKAPPGERIAKRIARAGVASRREAERMIELGQVRVNGKTIDSPALNVGPRDVIEVDGQPLALPEPARLWLYHKPVGLVTTERDEKGRETVFDRLPEDLPRVLSVGRLDISSEGLLLLTNDGALKRQLELPSTGWLRKYRVRVNGTPDEARMETLRKGITIEGERFQPMIVTLDRQQGANAWLTVGIREGRNREVRRAMEAIGLVVNRLIRVSYGPFQLGQLAAGAVEEVRARVLRDQLGQSADADPEAETRRAKPGGARDKPAPRGTSKGPARGAPSEKSTGGKPFVKPAGAKFAGSKFTGPKPYSPKPDGPKPSGAKPSGAKPARPRPAGAKPSGSRSEGPRSEGSGAPRGGKTGKPRPSRD